MMDSGVWWIPASVLLGCCLLVAAVYADRVYFARRRGVASAPTLPFIGSTWWTLMHKSRILHFVHEQFRAHGELVTFTGRWLGSPRYFFSASPAVVEHVLKTRFDNYVKGPLVRQNLNDLLGVGIFTVDGQQWKEQRKIASHMFSLREFRDTIFESVQRHCDSLDRILSALATNSDSPDTDFQSLFMRFTLDTIGDVAFGDDLGSLENPAVPFGRAFDGAQGIVEQRFVTPGWQVVELLTGSRFRLNAHVRVINTYCAELIAKRRDSLGESGARRDLLSRVMVMEDENGAALHLHDDAFLRDVILNFMIAGRDTTAQALSWAVYRIVTSPRRADIEQRLSEEAQGVLGHSRRLSGNKSDDDGGGNITYDDAISRLPYACAVLMETLRLHPSVPKDLKTALADDTLPDGTQIHSGDVVCWVPWSMGRMTALWGADAAEFKPERFLRPVVEGGAAASTSSSSSSKAAAAGAEWSAHKLKSFSPFLFASFNAGPRTCLGQGMAQLEGSLVLALIYRRFSLDMVEGQTIEYAESLTLPMAHGIRMRVRAKRS